MVKKNSGKNRKKAEDRSTPTKEGADQSKKAKKLLHNIWFSKKAQDSIKIEKAGGDAKLGKEFASYQGNIVKILEHVQTRVDAKIQEMEESIDSLKKFVVELNEYDENLEKKQAAEQKLLEEQIEGVSQAVTALKNAVERKHGAVKIDKIKGETEEEQTPEEHRGRNLQTPLENLRELVMEKGTIKVPEAAKKLGVTDDQVEEWAGILEEHGLIEIHYPAVGRPILKKKF